MTDKLKQAKKIVIIGDANVGKTSIITRYVTQKFEAERKTTMGAGFQTKEAVLDNGETVKL